MWNLLILKYWQQIRSLKNEKEALSKPNKTMCNELQPTSLQWATSALYFAKAHLTWVVSLFTITLWRNYYYFWWKIPEGSGKVDDFPANAPVRKQRAWAQHPGPWRMKLDSLELHHTVGASTRQPAGESCPSIYRLFPFPYENVTIHRQGHGLKYLLVNEPCI